MNEVNSQQEPGESLRQAREAAGLTTKDVADSLNLLLSNIEAIEANQYEHMNAGIFIRGYVKSYARFVGLDPEPLVAAADLRLKSSSKAGVKAPHNTPPAGSAAAKFANIEPRHKVIGALVGAALIWVLVSLMIAGDSESPAPAVEQSESDLMPEQQELETDLEAQEPETLDGANAEELLEEEKGDGSDAINDQEAGE